MQTHGITTRSGRIGGVTLGIVLLAGSLGAAAGAVEQRVGRLDFDPHHTVIAFHLPTRVHDVHGTFALREGHLTVDPTTGTADGTIVVDATSGESGNASRDGRMASVVLGAAQFPEIRFRAARVDGAEDPDGTFHGTLQGVLTLHGDEHPLAVAIEGHVVADELSARGRFTVPYVAWGLPDPSLFLLTVAQTVDVDVTTTGRIDWTETAAKRP